MFSLILEGGGTLPTIGKIPYFFLFFFNPSLIDQIEKFQCSSEREFPELFKTHLTFISGAIFVGIMANSNMGAFFLGHPVHIQFIF